MEEMNCDELVERVTDCLEEALDPGTMTKLINHLQVCKACDSYLDEVLVTLKVISGLPETSVPEGIEANLLAVYNDWARGVRV
jgi:hypothetical protein